MTIEQRKKIDNVIHTLNYIAAGKATNFKISAQACREVLEDVIAVDKESESVNV